MTPKRIFKNVVIWCTFGALMWFCAILSYFVALPVAAIDWLTCRDDTKSYVHFYKIHFWVITRITLDPLRAKP